jgi:SAM-dependent methyltransferase
MSGFSADWLARREPFDVSARNPDVLEAVSDLLRARSSVRIADLACGAGSTFRAIHKRLPARQHWSLIDSDPRLLAIARDALAAGNVELNAMQLDLSKNFDAAIETHLDLITMSALLDLISEAWLRRFVGKVAAEAIPVYASLTYDGRTDLSPADPFDPAILSAFNAHQATDKGFGPALGPAAARMAVFSFESSGYDVVCGNSDWVIGPADRAMQIELLEGWCDAASEMKMLSGADTAGWLGRRTRLVDEGRSSIRVGHVDLFAFPSTTR